MQSFKTDNKEEEKVKSKEKKNVDSIMRKKDKFMLMTLVGFSLLAWGEILLKILFAKKDFLVNNRTEKLLWDLSMLHRDHETKFLCSSSKNTSTIERIFNTKLDTFNEKFKQAKVVVPILKKTEDEYRNFISVYTNFTPSCHENGIVIETASTEYIDALIKYMKKIRDSVFGNMSLMNQSVMIVSFLLWFLTAVFCYAWKSMESWDHKVFDELFYRKKNKKFAKSFIQDIGVPVVVADKTMTILDVNTATSTVFGWNREELIGQNVTMLMPQSLRRNHQGHVNYFVQTRKAGIIGNTRGRAIDGVHKDGSTLKLIINISLSVNDQKKNPQFTAIFQDVTQQHNAQEIEKKQQADMAAILAAQAEVLQNLNAPVIIANEDMIITQANSAAERVFGYSYDEMIHQNVTLLMKYDDRKHHNSYVNKYKTTGVKKVIGVTRRIQGMHKNGSVISLILNMTKSKDATGDKYIAIFQDVTNIQKDISMQQ